VLEAELDELPEVEPLLDTGAATGVEFPVPFDVPA
jgi:hypothetical protein